MKDLRLTEMEGRFAELIWDHEPIPSGNLVKLCESELNWKKSTTYTMLKRLEAKEIFENDNGVVGSLIKKDDFYAEQSNAFVKETFGGSLPKFLAAFTKSRKLSDSEIDDVLRLIHEHYGKLCDCVYHRGTADLNRECKVYMYVGEQEGIQKTNAQKDMVPNSKRAFDILIKRISG